MQRSLINRFLLLMILIKMYTRIGITPTLKGTKLSIPLIDIASHNPLDFLDQPEFQSLIPLRVGMGEPRESVQVFSSHCFYQKPVDISLWDSQQRVHLSVWTKGSVNLSNRKHHFEIKQGGVIMGLIDEETWQSSMQGAVNHTSIVLPLETLIELSDSQGLAWHQQLREGHSFQVTMADIELLKTAHELEQQLLAPAANSLFLEAKTLELLARTLNVFSHAERPKAQLSTKHIECLYFARELLLADLANAPSIDAIAKLCGLNSLKLKAGFKALFGLPIYQYLQKNRLASALALIVEHGYSASQAGNKIGYTNLSHFSHAFQKQHGFNPSMARIRRDVG